MRALFLQICVDFGCCFRSVLRVGIIFWIVIGLYVYATSANAGYVPRYILDGLQVYQQEGYGPAVNVWTEGSPWANAAVVASRIAYLKNIEMMHGRYQGYDIIMTQETRISQMTYIRLRYTRLPIYALFQSQLRGNKWVLSELELHTKQRYAEAPQLK